MAEVRTNDFVVLLRISTAKTGGIDSNGIAAQRRDINLFLQQQENPRVIQEFVEVGSGAAKTDQCWNRQLSAVRSILVLF